jgi:hypothetical protein
MDPTIPVDCEACFTAHNIPAKFAGKRVKCPSCKATMTVPAPKGQRTATKSAPVRKAKPADDVDDVDFLDEDELDDDIEELPRPRKKSGSGKKKSKAAAGGGFFGPENKALSWGPWGGVLLMVIAVVWFVVGLMGNIIFYYPPILFIFGLIGTIKALISRD